MTSSSKISSPNKLLTSLQGGRAIAAILVTFYHTGLFIFALDKYWGIDPSRHFFDFGHAGVEFFFVLSGFIISYIHRKDLGHPSKLASYAAKRFLRIYPIYWLILAAITCVYLVVPSFGLPSQRQIGTILSSILLVHVNGNSNTEVAAAWTLYHEMLFYFLFSMAILNKKFGIILLTCWLLASAATLIATPLSYTIEFLLSPLHLLFGMGIVSCWIVTSRSILSPRLIAIIGLAIFTAAGMEEDYLVLLDDMPRNLIYGLGSALILIGTVELENQGRLRVPDSLLLIGNASYLIYLINFAVLSLLAKIFIHFGARENLPIIICYILLPVLTVLSGIVAHLLVERPLLRKLQGTRKSIAPPQPIYSFVESQAMS